MKRRSFLTLFGFAPMAAPLVAKQLVSEPAPLSPALLQSADDHLRKIKEAIKATFPKVSGESIHYAGYDAITVTANENLQMTEWKWSEGETEYDGDWYDYGDDE